MLREVLESLIVDVSRLAPVPTNTEVNQGAHRIILDDVQGASITAYKGDLDGMLTDGLAYVIQFRIENADLSQPETVERISLELVRMFGRRRLAFTTVIVVREDVLVADLLMAESVGYGPDEHGFLTYRVEDILQGTSLARKVRERIDLMVRDGRTMQPDEVASFTYYILAGCFSEADPPIKSSTFRQ